MFDGRWRHTVDRRTAPVGAWLQRRGITADILTATGLLSATGTAIAVATGHLHLAIGLLTLTGLHDLLDGPVAKAAGTASVRGAFFDSVTDRVADAVLMGGVTWYLVSTHQGHVALLPLAVLGVTALVSYERAKAEALGLVAKGGLMERAERMILLGAGFLATWLLVPDLWVLLSLTTVTAVGRFVRVWRAAEGPARPTGADGGPREVPATATAGAALATLSSPDDGEEGVQHHVARRRARVESRWRAWREGARGPTARGTGDPTGRWWARRQEAVTGRPGRVPRDPGRKTAGRSRSASRIGAGRQP